ncbi:LuxR C-terminal-related transcriptional regulator [Zymobacter sp. IVIA_12111.31 C1]|uniref:LuxR C-terminal-related transcriptional regulator n=1 Tax=Zymobacter sp. IVIA_12111.31 C1 TaxID=3394854 RepID=UPI0039C3501A
MSPWQMAFLNAFYNLNDMQDVLDIATKAAQKQGFEFCAWQTQLPIPLTQQRSFGLSSTDDEVHRKGREGGYDQSPCMQHCSRSTTPFHWYGTTSDSVFKQAPELFEEYYGWGHRGGWAQSAFDSLDTCSVFIADTSQSLTPKMLQAVDMDMQWIATAVHCSMLRMQSAKHITLTLREQEILKWSGDGKTAEEIAIILSLSVGTVNFHLRNAMLKLDAPNKISAIVKAIYLRLLD